MTIKGSGVAKRQSHCPLIPSTETTSKENIGKKILARYAYLIWFSQKSYHWHGHGGANGCENNIKGKSTKAQKILLLVTLAESAYEILPLQ